MNRLTAAISLALAAALLFASGCDGGPSPEPAGPESPAPAQIRTPSGLPFLGESQEDGGAPVRRRASRAETGLGKNSARGGSPAAGGDGQNGSSGGSSGGSP